MKKLLCPVIISAALLFSAAPSMAGDGGGSSISRRSREYAAIRNQPRVVINNNYYGAPPGYPAQVEAYTIYNDPYPYYAPYYYYPHPHNVRREGGRGDARVPDAGERYNIFDKTGEVKVWSRAPR